MILKGNLFCTSIAMFCASSNLYSSRSLPLDYANINPALSNQRYAAKLDVFRVRMYGRGCLHVMVAVQSRFTFSLTPVRTCYFTYLVVTFIKICGGPWRKMLSLITFLLPINECTIEWMVLSTLALRILILTFSLFQLKYVRRHFQHWFSYSCIVTDCTDRTVWGFL